MKRMWKGINKYVIHGHKKINSSEIIYPTYIIEVFNLELVKISQNMPWEILYEKLNNKFLNMSAGPAAICDRGLKICRRALKAHLFNSWVVSTAF